MRDQYTKSSSNRHSANESTNKSQLASRLKVIEFLRNQLYPTGKFCFYSKIKFLKIHLDSSISLFQQSNEELFANKRILNQRIREIRQKLMSHYKQEKLSL
jgi:hypothetical protein